MVAPGVQGDYLVHTQAFVNSITFTTHGVNKISHTHNRAMHKIVSKGVDAGPGLQPDVVALRLVALVLPPVC